MMLRNVIMFFLALWIAEVISAEPLLRYDLLRESCISDQSFPNLGSANYSFPLNRNGTTTVCSLGLGVENNDMAPSSSSITTSQHHLYSSQSLKPLLDALQNNESQSIHGITFEFWIKLLERDDANDERKTPILTVGPPVEDQDSIKDYQITECDKLQIDLQVSTSSDNVLEVLYRTDDQYYEPCYRVRLLDFPLQQGQLYHIAISLSDMHQQIFVNGEPSYIAREPFSNALKHWNTKSALSFFSYRHYLPWWNGQIFQFAIHGNLWGKGRVFEALTKGLPPSEPYVSRKSKALQFRMNEDADISPGHHPLEWYTTSRTYNGRSNEDEETSSFPIMELPIGFLDEEVDVLLQSLNIEHSPASRVYTYITRFPSRGALYEIDGTTDLSLSNSFESVVALKEPYLVFVPVHNEHSKLPGSTYASLDFCVTKHQIFAASQCAEQSSSATIAIVVDPINDPPQAVVGNPSYSVHEGIYEAPFALQLAGTDIDDGDSITAIEITSPPKMGYLYLSVSAFRHDGLLHGKLLSDLNYTVSGSEAYVEYRYLAGLSNQVVQGNSVTDSFSFRVRDKGGIWSADKSTDIQVISSVTVVPTNIIFSKEDDTPTVQLHGIDKSGLNRTLGYFIDAAPEESRGFIVEVSKHEALKKGEILKYRDEYPYHQGLNVTFHAASELCSTGSHANVSLSFRAIAFDEQGRIVSASSVMEQLVQFECNIDPLLLSTPQEEFTVYAFDASLSDPCSGYMYNASELEPESCPSAAIIKGIRVATSDTHRTEPVLVIISTSNGLLTVNQEQMVDIAPIEKMRDSIHFLAPAHKLNEILSYLHFQSDVEGVDKILIAIQYGKCGHKSVTEIDLNSKHPECYTTNQTIRIKVIPSIDNPKVNMFGDFPWIPLPFTFTMLFLLKLKGKGREKLNLVAKEIDEPKAATEEESVDTTVNDDQSDTSMYRWIQHYDSDSGFYYYENTEDGAVAWDPPDEEFKPAEEE